MPLGNESRGLIAHGRSVALLVFVLMAFRRIEFRYPQAYSHRS